MFFLDVYKRQAIHRTPGYPDHSYFETNILGAENVIAFAEKHRIDVYKRQPYGIYLLFKVKQVLKKINKCLSN